MKKIFTPQQKAVVALAAIKGERSIAEISGLHEVHSTQIKNWKQYAQDNLPALFADKRTKEGKTQERLIDDLYRIIGKREAELQWLKKKLHLELPGAGIPD